MKTNYKWIFTVFLLSFLLAMFFTFIAETVISNVSLIIGIVITLIIVFIGIICDMVGVAISTVKTEPFNAMASKKICEAKTALMLIKNKDKVSSIFCDVIGDVCGVITGSTGAAIIVGIVSLSHANTIIVSLIIMGLLSTITITGKAIGKNIAMRNSTSIIRTVAKVISLFKK